MSKEISWCPLPWVFQGKKQGGILPKVLSGPLERTVSNAHESFWANSISYSYISLLAVSSGYVLLQSLLIRLSPPSLKCNCVFRSSFDTLTLPTAPLSL